MSALSSQPVSKSSQQEPQPCRQKRLLPIPTATGAHSKRALSPTHSLGADLLNLASAPEHAKQSPTNSLNVDSASAFASASTANNLAGLQAASTGEPESTAHLPLL